MVKSCPWDSNNIILLNSTTENAVTAEIILKKDMDINGDLK